jgi:bacterioferritin
MQHKFQFDVEAVAAQLNKILQMELAGVIYYTHYSFMTYGHARIPIVGWLRENAAESLTHAHEGACEVAESETPVLGVVVPYAVANVLLTMLGPIIVGVLYAG